METLTLQMEFKGQNGDTGAYEGYISIKGNVDLGGDIVMPGAFRDVKTTRDGYLRMVYGHDMTKIIGKAKLIEDSTGYLVKGALNMKLSYVPDIYEQMKDGTLDGMSFGYSVNAGGADIKSVNGAIVRELKSLTVYEGSVVPFGMNPSAGVLAVKSMYEQQVLHKIYNSLSLFSAG